MSGLNHIDRALKKAEQAEQAGDKAKVKYWLDKASEYEEKLNGLKSHNVKIEQPKKIGGYSV